MTWRELIHFATQQLQAAGVDDATVNAEYLAAHACGWKNRSDIRSILLRPAGASQRTAFESFIARRAKREPLQYILGEWEFYGLPMKVGPGVLIPRPETEILVEEALKEALALPDRLTVIDVGTGSGAIALALAAHLPHADVLGIDVSPKALRIADANREAIRLPNVRFEHSDIMQEGSLREHAHSVDLLVSNPPYVNRDDFALLAPELRLFEPTEALTDNSTGLTFYARLAELACELLSPSGRLLVELGYDTAEAVREIMDGAELTTLRIVPDLSGIPRVLVAKR